MVRVFHFAAFVLLVCLAAPVDPPPGYFPPQFEHVGMGAQISGDFLQFLVRFKVVAKLHPALGGFKVAHVSRWKRFHGERYRWTVW